MKIKVNNTVVEVDAPFTVEDVVRQYSDVEVGVAVAVRAISGRVPISLIMGRIRLYSGLKSWPHSDMQCASSTA